MAKHLKLPSKFQRFLQPKRFKIAFGGRGSGKSTSFGRILSMYADMRPTNILCCRELQNSIKDSVHSLIEDSIAHLALPNWHITNASISSPQSKFIFKGIARNPDAIKSMNDLDVAWVEEAQVISQESLKLLTPTIRNDHSEIWMSANPMSSADPFSQRFIEPFKDHLERDGYYEDELHTIVVVNYCDNPYFPDVLEQERLFDKTHLSTAEYEHIWLGKYMDEVENSIISPAWFDAAIDAHKTLNFKPTGSVIAAHDPADMGKDSKGFAARKGSVVLDAREKQTGDANEGADWASGLASEHKADTFIWDSVGVGASLRRQIMQYFNGTQTVCLPHNGAEKPKQPTSFYQSILGTDSKHNKTNEDLFRNLRAQCWWILRDKIYNTYRAVEYKEYINPDDMISFPSDLETLQLLRSEICRQPRVTNAANTIQLMDKATMKKQGIQSPNLADSLAMTYMPLTHLTAPIKLNFAAPQY